MNFYWHLHGLGGYGIMVTMRMRRCTRLPLLPVTCHLTGREIMMLPYTDVSFAEQQNDKAALVKEEVTLEKWLDVQ